MKKIILVLMIVLASINIIACWDKQEIEDRAYITAMGIDGIEGKGDDLGFSITYEYPNLNAFGKAGEGEPRFTIASQGKTISEISRQLGTRIEKDIFFRHLKLVVIGEDVARDQVKLSAILNALDRTPTIGRKTVILVAKGKAKDILNTQIKENPVLGRFIWDLVERKNVGGRYYAESIGDLFTHLHRGQMGMIGTIMPGKDEVKLSGSAIVKNIRVIGTLDERDTTSILILRKKINNDEVTIVRDLGKYIVSYIIRDFQIKKSMKVEDGNIKITYDIGCEGYIEEYLEPETIITDTDILDTKKIKKIEKELNKEIEKKLLNTIHKLQQEYKADIIEIEDYISKKEPDLWKELREDWDNQFSKIEFSVNVNSKIRRVGMTK